MSDTLHTCQNVYSTSLESAAIVAAIVIYLTGRGNEV
jgi:hypothetical protein